MKHFTPQEANQRLPLVKQIVDDILIKRKALQGMLNEEADQELKEKGLDIQAEIKNLVGELQNLGCRYKDLDFTLGLVDFPSMIGDEEVLLCWRSDEPDLRWYHRRQEGYAERRLIPEYLLKD